jgi:hypothetical protein
MFLDILGEVTPLAVLQEKVEVVLRFLEIDEFDDMVVLQRTQDLHLRLESLHVCACIAWKLLEISSRGITFTATCLLWQL